LARERANSVETIHNRPITALAWGDTVIDVTLETARRARTSPYQPRLREAGFRFERISVGEAMYTPGFTMLPTALFHEAMQAYSFAILFGRNQAPSGRAA